MIKLINKLANSLTRKKSNVESDWVRDQLEKTAKLGGKIVLSF